jgi:hypothetical protein
MQLVAAIAAPISSSHRGNLYSLKGRHVDIIVKVQGYKKKQ